MSAPPNTDPEKGTVVTSDEDLSDVESDREKDDEKNFKASQEKQRDDPNMARNAKILYYVGVSNMIATIWFMSSMQWIMPVFYTFKFPFLIFGRLYNYAKEKWQLFLMDFCYFANTALVIYLWAFPHEPIYFQAIYAITHGPLSVAIITFQNSLVFHAPDKITSIFIHLTPPMVTYCIRWFHKPGQFMVPEIPQTAGAAIMNRFKPCVDDACTGNMAYLVGISAAFFFCHQLFYFIVVQVILGKKVKGDRSFLTTYRYLTRHHSGLTWRLIDLFGKPGHVFMFGFINLCFCILTLLPTIVYWNWWLADFLWIIFLGSVAIWNGAGFYSSVLVPPKASKPAATEATTK